MTELSTAAMLALIARSPGLRSAMAERMAAVGHGFTAEHDLALHPARLPELAQTHLTDAIDRLHGGTAVRLLVGDTRTDLVKAAALLLAAIDRIDAAPRDAGDLLSAPAHHPV